MIVEPGHDDVRSLHQPDLGLGDDAGPTGQHILHPRAAGIDQHAGLRGFARAGDGVLGRHAPDAVGLRDVNRAGAGADHGTAVGGIARGQHHEAGVIDEAIGIFEAAGKAAGRQRPPDLITRQIERAGRRQQLAAADMIVEEQSQPQQPCRPQAAMVRQHEAQRADDMRRDPPQDFALDQRLADQPELVIFEVAQAAMHELGRFRRSAARQIVHFAEEHRIAAADGVAGDAATVDAAPDDRQVEYPVGGLIDCLAHDSCPAVAGNPRLRRLMNSEQSFGACTDLRARSRMSDWRWLIPVTIPPQGRAASW